MNEERPVEKLLRRYAKKRRDGTGPAREMHPATRRLLQGEIARRFPRDRTEKRSGFESFAVLLRARWIYGLGVLVVIALAAALMLPELSKDKKVGDLASNKPAVEALSEQVPMLASSGMETEPVTVASTMPSDRSASTPRSVATAPQATTLGYDSKAVRLTDSSVPSRRDNVATAWSTSGDIKPEADGSNITKQSDEFYSEQDKQSFARSGGGNIISAAQNEQAVFRQSFANNAPIQSRLKTEESTKKKDAALLANFTIEQDERSVRVIDEDGSTYFGVSGPADSQSDFGNKSLLSEANKRVEALQASTNSFQFRVVGTNRTLNQKVFFSWNYLPTNAPTISNNGRFAAGQIKSLDNTARPQQFPGFQNFFLNGRAQIAGEKEVEINAAPVSQ